MWGKKRRRSSPDRTQFEGSESPEKALQYAVSLLARRAFSSEELRQRIVEKTGVDAKTADSVIEKLASYGYINDEKYALDYVTSRTRIKPMGRKRLERELAQKQVAGAVADRALEKTFEETSEEQLIDAAIEKRLRIRGAPKTLSELKSLNDHLLRLGFGYELISEKIRHLHEKHDR